MLHSLHKPELRNEPGMVYEIWEDGEITLQKSGDLYGQRTLHMIVPGLQGVNTPLPDNRGDHSCMAVHEDDIAIARKLIVGDVHDPYADCLPGKRQSQAELFAEINARHDIYNRSLSTASESS